MATKGLVVAVVLSLAGLVEGDLTFTSCTNAWVRLVCPKDEKLQVKEVMITTNEDQSCSQNNMRGPMDYPPVPSDSSHLCAFASECIWEETRCNDKSECAFFVADTYKDESGNLQRSKGVSIKYGCTLGSSRIGGIAGITIVTVGLVIVMIVTTFLICRKSDAPDEDMSKYVEFENRLSRTPSMSSEVSAKAEIKARHAAEGPFGESDVAQEKAQEKAEEARRQSSSKV